MAIALRIVGVVLMAMLHMVVGVLSVLLGGRSKR